MRWDTTLAELFHLRHQLLALSKEAVKKGWDDCSMGQVMRRLPILGT